MSEKRAIEALLALVRIALFPGQPAALAVELTAEEWALTCDLARKQTVAGLLFQGMQTLGDDALPPDDIVMACAARAQMIADGNSIMNEALRQEYAFFRAAGLEPVLLKGQSIGDLYPDPSMRQCGDIDFYFPNAGDCERAIEAVANAGAEISRLDDGSSLYLRHGVPVELHPSLYAMQSAGAAKKMQQAERLYGVQRQFIAQAQAEATVLAPEMNLMFLLMHARLHAACMGIGLRQLCDLAVFASRHEFDEAETRALLRSTGLAEWGMLCGAFIERYFGLAIPALRAEGDKADAVALLDVMMAGGNFGLHSAGRYDMKNPLARRVRNGYAIWLKNNARLHPYLKGYSATVFVKLMKRQFS